MPAHGRVLLFKMVVSDNGEAEPAKMLDIEMLVATVGGKERMAMEPIEPTKSPMCVIEAKAA